MCMCTRMCMSTKTISIMEDAYKMLANKKRKEESFSELIRRVLVEKKDIMRFAGAWSNISDKEALEIKENIRKIREHSTKELIKNIK